jgi:hypothetical protein
VRGDDHRKRLVGRGTQREKDTRTTEVQGEGHTNKAHSEQMSTVSG